MRGPKLIVLLAALAATLAACFDPAEPACPFRCGPGGACPASYSCSTDGLCHRDDGKGLCTTGPSDGSAD